MDHVFVPWIRKEAIFERAESLLEAHGLEDAPVECDFIIDEVFGVQVAIVEDLYRTMSINAFLSGGMSHVFVDEETFRGDSAWYNFSLAHEIGHIELHPQVFRAATHRTRAEYDKFRDLIGPDAYSMLERQAHLFAGALIAPAKLLERTADEVIGIVQAHGIKLTPVLEVDWPTIFRAIGLKLNANPQTIQYRMTDLGIYTKYL